MTRQTDASQVCVTSPRGGEGAPAPSKFAPIVRSGIVAEEFCRLPALAEVAGVFERSFCLRSGDLFVCVGEPGIGNGPLTLIAEMRVRDLGLRQGQTAVVSDSRSAIGAVAFTFDRCESWRAPRWPQACSPILLALTHDAVARRAVVEAEGFGRAMADEGECEPQLLRLARKRVARFESWLSDVIEAPNVAVPTLPDPVHDLIGLGHGLTPSGDDFLIGALALLDALAVRNAHAALARALDHIPPGLTSPLSRCFLRAAAAGHVGEFLHRAVSSMICGNADAAIAAIRRVGHSSGWDMMAGITSGLKVALTARAESHTAG